MVPVQVSEPLMLTFRFHGLLSFPTVLQGARNTGKSIVGQNIANPCAFIRASIDMLNFLTLDHQARVIEDAVMRTLIEDKVWTPDLGGQATTSDVVQNIVKYVKANA